MKVRNARRRLRQAASALMGLLFCLSIALGQFGACGCGPSCLHVVQFDEPAASPADSKPDGEASTCCPNPSANAPEQQPGAPCEDETGECGCPVMSVEVGEQGTAVLSNSLPAISASTAAQASAPPGPGAQRDSAPASTFARPCRGSPLPRPPLNILNVTFLI